MLRAVSSIYFESQAFELFAKSRRDVFKLFRTTSTASQQQQTVVTHSRSAAPPAPPPSPPPSPPPPPPPPLPRPRRAWTVTAAALALSASIGGVYFYRKLNEEEKAPPVDSEAPAPEPRPRSCPARASDLPERVQYLLVGGGTASFAAMRALRSNDPNAQVLIVGSELSLPYMRPPLSKEVWREDKSVLEGLADGADGVSFRQWNGRRRPLVYEPAAFYAAPRQLDEGAGLARGWTVLRLRPEDGEADLQSLDGDSATIKFDKCLVATGSRPRRLSALREARDAGRALALRDVRDAARIARALDHARTAGVVVVGGGLLGTEISAALRSRGLPVTLLVRGSGPLRRILPPYLSDSAARALAQTGVTLLTEAEVVSSELVEDSVELVLADGRRVCGGLVLECVGSLPNDSLAAASGLERDEQLGGLVVSADLRARGPVYAAGDVASVHAPHGPRQRLAHHDHAVRTARLAAHNMAAHDGAAHDGAAHDGAAPRRPRPRLYTPHSMFWSDLPHFLGYEAIGTIDSRLRTVGVFCEDAVTDTASRAIAAAATVDQSTAETTAPTETATPPTETSTPLAEEATLHTEERGSTSLSAVTTGAGQATLKDKHFERGVVLYLRDERVVGVLLWNLFNRIHVARQVLEQGYFEDLFEVAKLFTLHEEE